MFNIRSALETDFGIKVRIEGGEGLRSDPFLIEKCSADEAVETQLKLLRGLGYGRQELWRLTGAEPVPDADRLIQKVRIDAVRFTARQVISESRAFYFDLGKVEGRPDPSAAIPAWADSKTGFIATHQLGWWHFDRAIDNAPGRGQLNTTLQYSCLGAKAALYVYEAPFLSTSSEDHRDGFDAEFSSICDCLQKTHPTAQSPWEPISVGPLVVKHFLVGEDLTVAALAYCRDRFIKLRLTFHDDYTLRELMMASIEELASQISRCKEFGARLN